MRMRDLEGMKIPKDVVDVWCAAESEELLPIQQEAIATHGILAGRSVLIAAPSSSGKTFIAEVAVVAAALRREKALFLVSHKAIAEEKFADFRSKYSDYGLRVLISTGDHRTYDEDLSGGNFDLAVLTYEKCLGFLVSIPAMIRQCSLLVVNEVQMLGDPERGPDLELLLTRVRALSPQTQVIALSGVIPSPNRLDEWLGASSLGSQDRPIPLERGCAGVMGH